MGLSMCSSIFSEKSPVRSKSGIINELSGFPNRSNSAMQLYQLQLAWSYRPCILHLLCRKTLVLSAEFGTKIKFDLSTFIQKLLVFIKNYSTIHRSDKESHFSYLEILISGESYQSKTRYTYSKWCNSVTKNISTSGKKIYESSAFGRCRKAHCACILAPQHLCAATEVN